jgi:hypothetical protein
MNLGMDVAPWAARSIRAPRRRLGARVLLALATFGLPVLAGVSPASALDGCGGEWQQVTLLTLEGLDATAPRTVAALLPRPAPAPYKSSELVEFERRLKNLGIFDAVEVGCKGTELRVRVREKWTLVPNVALATGKTLADTYALIGVTEYNFLGTANRLALSASRERRGFGFNAAYTEHDYQRRGWSLGAVLNVATAAFRFEDDEASEDELADPAASENDASFEPDEGWRTTSVLLELSGRSPPLGDYFNYIAGFYGSREIVHDAQAADPPPSTWVLQSFMGFAFDAYEWHDLVPAGVQTSVWLSVGGLFGEARPAPRHTAEWKLRAALPLGAKTVLIGRVNAVVTTLGNANYGFVIGSVNGVRGLPDSTYFTWAQGLANLELRHSFQLWPRWALQAVAFADAAAFEQLTADGTRGDRTAALSLGAGARVVPTWLSSLILRLDVARLMAPDDAWFVQVGLDQYF